MQGAPSRLQVRLAADAASVPAVRRFVADGLAAWGEAKLVDAAELVASELSSNAALHAMAEIMHVTLERVADDAAGVRVAVEDDGDRKSVVQGVSVVSASGAIGEWKWVIRLCRV